MHRKVRMSYKSVGVFRLSITGIIDQWLPVDIIYLDFQKAFDKVPHRRLLLKLKAHSIGSRVLDWIEIGSNVEGRELC